MGHDAVFLLWLAGAAALFALIDGATLLLKRRQTAWATGVITATHSPNAKTTSYRNSKWAEVAYTVGNTIYYSQSRIQVPLSARVGDAVNVRYDTQRPERLYTFSVKRVLIFAAMAAACLIAALIVR